MGTLIDSSVLMAAQRGQLDLEQLSGQDDEDAVAMSAMSASELLHGMHRLGNVVAQTRAQRFSEHVLSAVPVIPFDLGVARVHAALDAELSLAGMAVGDADLIIAATAISLDYRIATRDLRSFRRIKGLHVVRW